MTWQTKLNERFIAELNFCFQDLHLLEEALSHSSYVHEKKESLPSNERLEFLGDSILGLLISELLVRNNPHMNEGDLSRFRGSLVNETLLGKLGRVASIGEMILLGKGEINSGGRDKDVILADTVEALMGAAYLDGGLTGAKSLFDLLLKKYREKTGEDYINVDRVNDFDAKTQLQEKTMEYLQVLPKYQSTTLQDGNFKVELYIGEQLRGSVVAHSKKLGEKELARMALKEKWYKGE